MPMEIFVLFGEDIQGYFCAYSGIECIINGMMCYMTTNNIDMNDSCHKFGRVTCLMVFLLGIFYVIITAIGLFSLESPQDTIGNPYFTIMEILSILIALLMAISLAAVHHYAPPVDKFFSLIAVILMFVTTAITSCVHFVILSVSHHMEEEQLAKYSFLFSFNWPSVVYALDVLAWDLFFALSVLFAAKVFSKNKFEKKISLLLVICGILSLIGLIGVPLQNMQIRNIGIIGYAIIAPVAFFLIGKTLGRLKQTSD